jgi:hypothetical protein
LAYRRAGRIVPILTEISVTPCGSAPGMLLFFVQVFATINFGFVKDSSELENYGMQEDIGH